VRVKPGQQAPAGPHAMSPAELQFVKDLGDLKPNLEVYRTNGKNSQGDFLVIDRSNPEKPVGWVVELKSKPGGAFPGNQFMNADQLQKDFKLTQMQKIAGTNAEMLQALNRGRGSWG
jgi:hypothetical protein